MLERQLATTPRQQTIRIFHFSCEFSTILRIAAHAAKVFSQPDIIGQKKARISVLVGAEDRLNRCKLVGPEHYRFLRGDS